MAHRTLSTLREQSYDVCVVGAGPLGIAVALECEGQGLSVLLIESGSADASGSSAVELYGSVVDTKVQAPLDIAVCRALGGTSWWWGGRCLPMEPVDFAQRGFVPEGQWPIGLDAITPFNARAAHYLDCGGANFFSAHPAWANLGGGVSVGSLERWSRTREAALKHGPALEGSTLIDVCLETSVTNILAKDGLVTGVELASNGAARTVQATQFVLAAGGLGTALLLQRHRLAHPEAFGGAAGALGHYYMGHTHGTIADIVLSDPSDAESVDFYLDKTGAWVRRRIGIDAETQIANGMLNVAFWADNPSFHDARHRNGILSAVYLALSIPPIGRLLVAEGIRRMHIANGGNYLRHIANVILDPIGTISSAWSILRQRYVEKPRRPGFLIRNKSGRYALTYHGEQAPRRDSAAMLVNREAGLSIDLKFSELDAQSVVTGHAILDASLRAAGKGHLEYTVPEALRVETVLGHATDGFHQQGLLRMGDHPASSVVDGDCMVHGFANLSIASTGVMTTSGQANPTFTGCALAVRLAHHLIGLIKEPAHA